MAESEANCIELVDVYCDKAVQCGAEAESACRSLKSECVNMLGITKEETAACKAGLLALSCDSSMPQQCIGIGYPSKGGASINPHALEL